MANRALRIDPIAEARRQWVLHGWEAAADGMAAVTSIVRVQQILLQRIETELKPYGLSFARFELLTLLSFTKEGALPMSSASTRLQVHPTSLTSLVNRLENDGLVARTAHPSDRRATLISITDDGRALVLRAAAPVNERVFADLGIPHDELKQLTSILARFRKLSGDFADPPTLPEPL